MNGTAEASFDAVAVDAVAAAIARGQLDHAVELVYWLQPATIELHIDRLAAAARRLDRAKLFEHPVLCYTVALGEFRTLNKQQHGVRLAQTLVAAIARIDPAAVAAQPLHTIFFAYMQAMIERMAGQRERMLAKVQHLSALVERYIEQHSTAVPPLLPHFLIQVGETQLRLGEESDAIITLVRALGHNHEGSPSHTYALANLATAYAIAGERLEAAHTLQTSQSTAELLPRLLSDHWFSSIADPSVVWEHLERSAFAEAAAAAEIGYAEFFVLDGLHLFAEPLALAYIGLGRVDEGAIAVQELRTGLARQRDLPDPVLGWFDHAELLLAIARGETGAPAAEALLRIAAASPVVGALDAARLAIARGRWVEAQQALAAIEPPVERSPRRHAELRLLLTACALGRRDLAAAERSLRQAAFILRRKRLRSPLLTLTPDGVTALLSHAASIDVDLHQDLPAPPFGSAKPVVAERPRLTRRELAVLAGLLEEESSAGIAARNGVSVNTIKTQLRRIYAKLGVHSRNDALTAASELGLLE